MGNDGSTRQRALARNLASATAVALAIGWVPTAARSLARDDGLDALGGATLVALASLGVGGLLGFLFGVPRARVVAPDAPAGPARYGGNTNLEQISDWLTKILVGVGLTQLGALREGGARLFDSIAPVLGGQADDPAFAGVLVVYFAIVGFVAGWLGTRLYLGAALTDADRALDLLDLAAQAEAGGDEERAEDLRRQAADLLAVAAPHARRYEDLRARLRSGPDRTRALEQVVADARRLAGAVDPTAANLRVMFDSGEEGDRVVALALMSDDADRVDIDRAMAPLRSSRSAFELYYALAAIERHVAERPVDAALADRILAGLDIATSEGRIPPGSDRADLVDRIRPRLTDPEGPEGTT